MRMMIRLRPKCVFALQVNSANTQLSLIFLQVISIRPGTFL